MRLRGSCVTIDLNRPLCLHDYDAGDGIRLTLHVGLGAGAALELTVGGWQGRWEMVVAGAWWDHVDAVARGRLVCGRLRADRARPP